MNSSYESFDETQPLPQAQPPAGGDPTATQRLPQFPDAPGGYGEATETMPMSALPQIPPQPVDAWGETAKLPRIPAEPQAGPQPAEEGGETAGRRLSGPLFRDEQPAAPAAGPLDEETRRMALPDPQPDPPAGPTAADPVARTPWPAVGGAAAEEPHPATEPEALGPEQGWFTLPGSTPPHAMPGAVPTSEPAPAPEPASHWDSVPADEPAAPPAPEEVSAAVAAVTPEPWPTLGAAAPAAPAAEATETSEAVAPGTGAPAAEQPEAAPEEEPKRTRGGVAPNPRIGNPIRYPGLRPAACTAVLGVLLTALTLAGRPAAAVAVLVLQGLTAAGWFRLNGMWPARQGIALAGLAGIAADAVILLTPAGAAWQALVGTAGVAGLAVLVLQMVKRAPQGELTDSLTASSVATALTVLAAAWLPVGGMQPAAHSSAGAVVTLGALGVAAAVLVRAGLLAFGKATALAMEAVSLVVSLLVTAGLGAVLGGAVLGTGAGAGAAVGAAAAVGALIGHRVASYDYPSRFVHMTAGVALPLTCAIPVVYLSGWAIG